MGSRTGAVGPVYSVQSLRRFACPDENCGFSAGGFVSGELIASADGRMVGSRALRGYGKGLLIVAERESCGSYGGYRQGKPCSRKGRNLHDTEDRELSELVAAGKLRWPALSPKHSRC